MKDSICPFCGKEINDILSHFFFIHDIQNLDNFKVEIEKVENEEKKRIEFRTYVEELKKEVEKGNISNKDYRGFVTNWNNKYFISYVEELNKNMENGKITKNEYWELVTNWSEE